MNLKNLTLAYLCLLTACTAEETLVKPSVWQHEVSTGNWVQATYSTELQKTLNDDQKDAFDLNGKHEVSKTLNIQNGLGGLSDFVLLEIMSEMSVHKDIQALLCLTQVTAGLCLHESLPKIASKAFIQAASDFIGKEENQTAAGFSIFIDYMKEHLIDVNVRDDQSRTALHFAVQHNLPDLAKHLISKGAQILVLDNERYTPLTLAFQLGHDNILSYLLK